MKIDVRCYSLKAFSASSGPGGQHVNKVATAVELRCRVDGLGLVEDALERLRTLAGRRLTDAGEIVLVGRQFKSLEKNRAEVVARLEELVAKAKRRPRVRKATQPTRASKVRKLDGKRRKGDVKRLRRRPGLEN